MTTLHITVGSRERAREEALEFIDAGEAGELSSEDGKSILQFGSYGDFVDNLTPLRLELVRVIAEHHPESMRETARLVDRDVSDVHTDLKNLEVLGVLELEEGGPGGAIQPTVPFDKIEMHIDYPLVDDPDADEAQAGT